MDGQIWVLNIVQGNVTIKCDLQRLPHIEYKKRLFNLNKKETQLVWSCVLINSLFLTVLDRSSISVHIFAIWKLTSIILFTENVPQIQKGVSNIGLVRSHFKCPSMPIAINTKLSFFGNWEGAGVKTWSQFRVCTWIFFSGENVCASQ